MRQAPWLLCTVGALVAAATPALAEHAIVRGAVVKLEHQEIYVSVGARQRVTPGAALRLKRPIKLRHPVTRAPVEDWLPIGSATVTQAGTGLSRAVIGELVISVRVGDVVEVFVEDDTPALPAPGPSPVPPPTDPTPAAPRDEEAIEVLRIFAQQTGQSIDARIAGWERYLSVRASSRFAAVVRRDLETLRALRDQLQAVGGAQENRHVADADHHPRSAVAAGRAVPLVFVLDEPDRVASAYLHYRSRGARTFRRLLLVREHDRYLRGVLPATIVQPPGVDYFVEVSAPDGASGLALASPIRPISLEVEAPTLIDRFGPMAGRSSVKIAVDYLDFETFDTRAGAHTDHMVTGNVDFIYRLASAVQSVGVGYGVFSGAGGFRDQVYDPAPVPRSGFHFGYADLEVGGTPQKVALSAGAKLIAGVGKEGFGLGVEGRFRIGHRDATNLLLAARTIEQIGWLTDIRFGARPAQNLLIGISVGATDQPNRGDVGVKLGTEFEWIGLRNVSLIVRGSWQGRSVAHGGVGAGGGLGVYW